MYFSMVKCYAIPFSATFSPDSQYKPLSNEIVSLDQFTFSLSTEINTVKSVKWNICSSFVNNCFLFQRKFSKREKYEKFTSQHNQNLICMQ